MKEKFMNMRYSLVAMLTLLIGSALFVSCGEEDVQGDNIYYSVILDIKDGGNSDVIVKEITDIKKAFSKSLGVDLTSTKVFHYTGTLERCDSQVRNACTEAKASLAGTTWQGNYVITVTNENTEMKIYEYTFGTAKEE